MATATTTTTKTEWNTRMYIDGRWTDAIDGGTLAVINPANELTIAEVAHGGRADADRAIDAAARPFPPGRRCPSMTAPKSSRKPPN